MKKYKIEVTERNIKEGDNTFSNCPVARAVRRVTKAKKVEVGSGYIDSAKWWVLIPFKVAKFIGDFDDGLPVKPFTFILKIREY